jgi:hypothetical protein
MRKCLIMLPLLLSASPALAQDSGSNFQVPRELTDPRTADKVDRAMQAMTKALLNLKVGEVQAAAEGRNPTPAERKLTVGDIARRDHVDVQRQIAEAGPKIAQGMKALSDALPAIMKAVDDASRAVDRAAANMPDPTYPKR